MIEPSDFFLNPQLNSFVDQVPLWPIALLLALMLGRVFYTDAFKGHLITNITTMGVFCLSLPVAVFLFSDLSKHFLFAFGFAVVMVLLTVFADFGEGDTKIYSALGVLLGPAVFVLFLVSAVITLLWNLPQMINNFRQHRRAKQDGQSNKLRLGKAPLGPGIAVSFPITLAVLGVSIVNCLAILAVIIISLPLYWLDDKITAKAEAKLTDEKTESEAISEN